MRAWAVVLALVVAVGLVASAAEEESAVISLTNETIGEIRTGIWFVKYFVSWCGHCRVLAPKWEELATIAAGRYHVAEVNCADYRDLCEGVRFYPTLKLYKEGREDPFVYEGPREVEPLNDFVEFSVDLQYGPEEKTVEKMLRRTELLAARTESLTFNLETLVIRGEEAMKSTERRTLAHNLEQRGRKTHVEMLTEENFDRAYHGAWLVRFLDPADSAETSHTELWDELAERYGWVFHVADVDCKAEAKLCQLENIDSYPSFVMYLEGTIGPVKYKDDITLEDLANFVFENIESVEESRPLTDEEIEQQIAFLRDYMEKHKAEQQEGVEGEQEDQPQEEKPEEKQEL